MKRSTVTKLLAVLAVLLGVGLMVSVIAFLCGGMTVRWLHISKEQVGSIEIRSGDTGETFVLDTPEEIETVAAQVNRIGPRVGLFDSRNGYRYHLTVKDTSGETLEAFTVVGEDTLSIGQHSFSANVSALLAYLQSADTTAPAEWFS